MKRLVSFFEIPAIDFNRAVNFYETVLKTKLTVVNCEYEQMAFFSDETKECCGAISCAKDFNPSKDGVLISLYCDDIDETLALIEENGGDAIIPKTGIEAEDAGYFGVFTDCEGNRVGLWCEK